MTDTSAWLLNQLPAATRATVMEKLFGAAGIHLSFIRLPIGASDFTARGVPYSYDDLPPGRSDPGLIRFSIAHDRAYILPALREMLTINPEVQILASLWSAPGWMKANGSLDNLREQGTVLPSAYGALARYFVRFIEAYASAGVPVQAVTPQNEPGLPTGFPGMSFPEPTEARFIAHYLAPALRAAGLQTQIYGFDFHWFLAAYAHALASDPAVLPDIAGIAWHCYRGNPDAMTTLHGLAPVLDQVETECSSGIAPGPPAELAIASLRNWASGVVLWNLALDPRGGPIQPHNGCRHCTGVVTVDRRTGHVSYGRDYYQLGQASSFVQRDARRIGSEHFVRYRSVFLRKQGSYATAGLDDVAFVNPDGSKVLLAYNSAPHAINFAVTWHGRWFTYRLPSQATVTFTWR
jgi:glucosylceramidase